MIFFVTLYVLMIVLFVSMYVTGRKQNKLHLNTLAQWDTTTFHLVAALHVLMETNPDAAAYIAEHAVEATERLAREEIQYQPRTPGDRAADLDRLFERMPG